MKRQLIRLFFFAMPVLMLAACSRDDLTGAKPEENAADRSEIRFEMGFAATTRVLTGANFKSTWEEGDAIGIYAVKHVSGIGRTIRASDNFINNKKLIYDGNSWVFEKENEDDKLFYPYDGELLDFYAYYPYDENMNPTGTLFHVKDDQTSSANFSSSDLMNARHLNVVANQRVYLNFSHLMALVQVEIPSREEILSVTLKNCSLGRNYFVEDGALSDLTGEVKMLQVEGDTQSQTTTFRALLPHQNLSTELHFRISNVKYFCPIKGDIKPNNAYPYTVTLLAPTPPPPTPPTP